MMFREAAILLGLVAFQGQPPAPIKAEDIHVFGDRLVLFLRYEVSAPGVAADLRARFDGDGNGQLGSDERQALADYVLRLATEDLRLSWDDHALAAVAILKATGGLDRPLPSTAAVVLYWQLNFELPEWAPGARHELRFSDRRGAGPFGCRVRLGPGVDAEVAEPVTSFEFPAGEGSFRMGLLFQAPHDRQRAREPGP